MAPRFWTCPSPAGGALRSALALAAILLLTAASPRASLPVGFRTFRVYDHTRPYLPKATYRGQPIAGEIDRPIQIAAWYPALIPRGAKPMVYDDYLLLDATRGSFRAPTKAESEAHRQGWIRALSALGPPGFDPGALLREALGVYRDAPVAGGSFPVVIYAPGADAESFDNSVLCEKLAGHGYFVLASESLGPHEPLMRLDQEGLEAQVRDIEFLYGFGHGLKGADPRRVALMGFSWGGLASVIEQMRNPLIDAVLAGDGSIKGFYRLAKSTAGFDCDRVRSPFLLLSGSDPGGELLYFNDLRYAPAHVLGFQHLDHSDMNSYAYLVRRSVPESDRPDRDRLKLAEYEWLCDYVLLFLDAYLRHDAAALGELRDPGRPPAPALRLFREKRAPRPPPTKDQFLSILREEGVPAAVALYREVRASDPVYSLFDEDYLANVGFQYFNGMSRHEEGIGIMRLNLEAHPGSYKAHGFLGRLLEKAGDLRAASQYYREACEIGANDPAAEKGWLDYFKLGLERVSR